MTIKILDTNATINVPDLDTWFSLYWELGSRFSFEICGEVIRKSGPTGNNGYFGGYTKSYFEKFFKEDR